MDNGAGNDKPDYGTGDTIFLDSEVDCRWKYGIWLPPREIASDGKSLKHVHCEGARFHVLSYSTNVTRCSEPDCIVNRRLSRCEQSNTVKASQEKNLGVQR